MTLLEKLQTSGIRRDGTPKSGFRYRHANGKPVTAAEAERIRALKLPPAWTEVRIDPNPRAHLVAIGKDKAGRWQYRYHEAFREKQETQKFERIVEFAEALPAMRAAVRRHIHQDGMGREKVMACILKILSSALARAGVAENETKHGRRKKVVDAVKEAAEILGNTPAICKASYIYPSVLSSFDRGRTVERYFGDVEELVTHRGTGLHASEKALLELLKEDAKGNRKGAQAARRRLEKATEREWRARARQRGAQRQVKRRGETKTSGNRKKAGASR